MVMIALLNHYDWSLKSSLLMIVGVSASLSSNRYGTALKLPTSKIEDYHFLLLSSASPGCSGGLSVSVHLSLDAAGNSDLSLWLVMLRSFYIKKVFFFNVPHY